MTHHWKHTALALAVCGTGLLLMPACEGEPGEGPAGADSAAVRGGDQAKRGAGKRPGRGGPHGKKGKKGMGKHGKKGGAAALLRHALRDLELKEEQQSQLEDLLGTIKPTDDLRKAEQACREGMAEGVRAGTIDEAAQQEKAKAVDALKVEQHKRMGEALTKLHGMLTPEQRKTLVEGVRKRKDRAAGPPWMDPEQQPEEAAEPAEAAEPSKAAEPPAADDAPPEDKGKKGKRGRFGMMGKMIRRLELTEEQQAKLDKAWTELAEEPPSPEQRKEHREARQAKMDALLDAFAADTFDGVKALGEDFGKKKTEHLEQTLKMIKPLLPILTEEQRGKLADMLLKARSKGKMRGGKRGGMRDGMRGMK